MIEKHYITKLLHHNQEKLNQHNTVNNKLNELQSLAMFIKKYCWEFQLKNSLWKETTVSTV